MARLMNNCTKFFSVSRTIPCTGTRSVLYATKECVCRNDLGKKMFSSFSLTVVFCFINFGFHKKNYFDYYDRVIAMNKLLNFAVSKYLYPSSANGTLVLLFNTIYMRISNATS